jgi:hypothetical protein
MVKTRKFKVPQYPHYFAWVDDPKSLLSNDGLKNAIAAATNDEVKRELEHVLKWSEQVNVAVKDIVKDVPPFPYIRESLEKMQPVADLIVVSGTPGEALAREWEEHDIATRVGRTRHCQIRRGYSRPGNGDQNSASELHNERQVRKEPRYYDRRRAR